MKSDIIVYVDMDGVLADFRGGYFDWFGAEPINTAVGDPNTKKLIGTNFFSQLKKLPNADKVISIVLKYVETYSIASSPLREDHYNSSFHKTRWIEKNLAPQPKQMIFTGKKDSYAKGKNILIDDRPEVLEKWMLRGGVGIWYNGYIHNPIKVDLELSKAMK